MRYEKLKTVTNLEYGNVSVSQNLPTESKGVSKFIIP